MHRLIHLNHFTLLANRKQSFRLFWQLQCGWICADFFWDVSSSNKFSVVFLPFPAVSDLILWDNASQRGDKRCSLWWMTELQLLDTWFHFHTTLNWQEPISCLKGMKVVFTFENLQKIIAVDGKCLSFFFWWMDSNWPNYKYGAFIKWVCILKRIPEQQNNYYHQHWLILKRGHYHLVIILFIWSSAQMWLFFLSKSYYGVG